MTEPTYTGEQAEAIHRDFNLLVAATKQHPGAHVLAERVHVEVTRRMTEWAIAEGHVDPDYQPCCPWRCEDCGDDEQTCFDDQSGVAMTVNDGGIEWSIALHHIPLITLPFEVIWGPTDEAVEGWIAKTVQDTKDRYLARKEHAELRERGLLTELQHKYESQEKT